MRASEGTNPCTCPSFATKNVFDVLQDLSESIGGSPGPQLDAAEGQPEPIVHDLHQSLVELLERPEILSLHAVRRVGRERQLHLKVRALCGEVEKVFDVLVDTGAQVSLVNAGLLPPECLTDSRKPVRLKVANGQYMVGGTKEAAIGLQFVNHRELSRPDLGKEPVFPPPVRGPYGEAKIRLKQDPRVYRHREFALRGERKEAMEKILRDFIQRGWLEPCHSEWASPCFVVPKKVAAEWRLVVDYRGLNAQTQHDSYTLPLIEDMLQKQHRRRIFTVIDLKHGYHQMPLAEESRACTAMSTPLGPLQWKVMPMGVTNGNAAFQRMLENLLEPVRDCADPFVDDVIIASGDPSMSYKELLEAHERDVTRVLDLLVRHKLTGSSDKATIAVSEVVFAGHVVGNGQRKPIPGKVAAIEHWEKPKTVSELRAYLGFCNYYSGYIKMYAEYAAPMTDHAQGQPRGDQEGVQEGSGLDS